MSRLAIAMIPAAVSCSRIVIGAVFPFLPATWRLPAVALAAFTDVIDGPISRWLKVDGYYGQVLDPIADKIFLVAVLITIVADGSVTWWEVVLAETRDIAILIAYLVVVAREGWPSAGRVKARLLGKLTTGFQIAFVVAVLLGAGVAARILAPAAALVGIAACVDYLIVFRRSGESPEL